MELGGESRGLRSARLAASCASPPATIGRPSGAVWPDIKRMIDYPLFDRWWLTANSSIWLRPTAALGSSCLRG